MSLMINRERELIRINPDKKTEIQYSKDNGKNWNNRSANSASGEFQDLINNKNKNEILATTSKGVYYSKNNGKTWNFRGK